MVNENLAHGIGGQRIKMFPIVQWGGNPTQFLQKYFTHQRRGLQGVTRTLRAQHSPGNRPQTVINQPECLIFGGAVSILSTR